MSTATATEKTPEAAPVIASNKVLIVPQDADLAARILQLSGATNDLAISDVREAIPERQVLAIRREALRSFGHSIQKEAALLRPQLRRGRARKLDFIVRTASAGEALMELKELKELKKFKDVEKTAVQVEASPGEENFQILEGIGALIADGDSIDKEKVEEARALVLPNIEISSVPSIPSAETLATVDPASLWHLVSSKALAKHAEGLTGGGTTVGVLDSGIDPQHPEFAGKTVLFQEFDLDGNPVAGAARDTDLNGHGTHVSGLLAGRTVGIAPAASLAVAAVMTIPKPDGTNSGTLLQITGGLNWLRTMASRNEPTVYVINASVGIRGFNSYLYSPIYTILLAPGALVTAAIGNYGLLGMNQHCSPGNYDIVVGVGAIDQSNNVCPFSDWGNQGAVTKPDLCAPGARILSSIPGGRYGYMSGTSMASPLVAGAAVLILQRDPTLVANPTAIHAKLRSLVRPLTGPLNMTRGGMGTLDLTSL